MPMLIPAEEMLRLKSGEVAIRAALTSQVLSD